jgi:hypothetical protein
MASVIGVNRTMAQAVGFAKTNHDWQNQTGTLERGHRIISAAADRGSAVSGLWGVANVLYAKYLEARKKYAWLMPAAREIHPRLKGNIKAAYGNG